MRSAASIGQLPAVPARRRHRQRQDRGLPGPDRAGAGAGRQSLLLVPEIGLAPQTLRRLRERLGVAVEVLHSNLSEGERARAWLRARSGEAQGDPGHPLGRVHAAAAGRPDHRGRGARRRLQAAGGVSLPRARPGAGTRPRAGRAGRAGQRHAVAGVAGQRRRPAAIARCTCARDRRRPQPPQVQIVDVRAQCLDHGLSPALLAAVRDTVARGEQVLVFRNRRGYAPVLLCHACGWHADCPRCERPLTLHAGRRQLLCHHCDYRSGVPAACPGCGAGALWPQGQGTERLEEALTALFPDVPVLRIDRETTRRRDAFEHLLDGLRTDAAGDPGRHPDAGQGPRSAQPHPGGHRRRRRRPAQRGFPRQRTAGPAGGAGGRPRRPRAQARPGRCCRPIIRNTRCCAACWPMATRAAAARTAGRTPADPAAALQPPGAAARGCAGARRRRCLSRRGNAGAARQTHHLQIAGPMPAPMPLRAGRHRGQLLLEATSRSTLHGMLRSWQTALAALPSARKVRWSLDVDPIDLY